MTARGKAHALSLIRSQIGCWTTVLTGLELFAGGRHVGSPALVRAFQCGRLKVWQARSKVCLKSLGRALLCRCHVQQAHLHFWVNGPTELSQSCNHRSMNAQAIRRLKIDVRRQVRSPSCAWPEKESRNQELTRQEHEMQYALPKNGKLCGCARMVGTRSLTVRSCPQRIAVLGRRLPFRLSDVQADIAEARIY